MPQMCDAVQEKVYRIQLIGTSTSVAGDWIPAEPEEEKSMGLAVSHKAKGQKARRDGDMKGKYQ
jgi:hypothetical protein